MLFLKKKSICLLGLPQKQTVRQGLCAHLGVLDQQLSLLTI